MSIKYSIENERGKKGQRKMDACILKCSFSCALKNQFEKQLLIACTRDHRAIYVTFFHPRVKSTHVLNGHVINSHDRCRVLLFCIKHNKLFCF